MPKPLAKAEKAYKNLEFLNSPGARPLRILSEFLEPMNRFRSLGIKDTIVFFGSAKIKSRKDAKRTYDELKKKSRRTKKLTWDQKRKLEDAATALAMSRYYEDAAKLSRMLTDWSRKLYDLNRFVCLLRRWSGHYGSSEQGSILRRWTIRWHEYQSAV